MLYFYLDTSEFIDPIIDGLENNQGAIESHFLNTVLPKLSKVKTYVSIWSEDPPFKNIPVVSGKKICLTGLDDETSEESIDKLRNIMENAHAILIPYLGKSLNDMHLHYDYVCHISKKDADNAWKDYMAENNLQDITETVGSKNMTLDEKITFICTELEKIGSKEQTLTIIDPYIFPKNCDSDYVALFIDIIKKSGIRKLKIITNPKNIDNTLQNNILNSIAVPYEVKKSKKLHDRWWVIENKRTGFLLGASLNGVGKGKLSTIKTLTTEEVEDILQDLSTIQ